MLSAALGGGRGRGGTTVTTSSASAAIGGVGVGPLVPILTEMAAGFLTTVGRYGVTEGPGIWVVIDLQPCDLEICSGPGK